MKPVKSFVDTVTERLKNHVEKNRPARHPSAHNEMLEAALIGIAFTIANDQEKPDLNGKSKVEVMEYIKNKCPAMFQSGGGFFAANEEYVRMYAECGELRDVRVQEAWASTREHVKTLFFRTASTLMIASVVLATGYFAHKWGIPLPMLRPMV